MKNEGIGGGVAALLTVFVGLFFDFTRTISIFILSICGMVIVIGILYSVFRSKSDTKKIEAAREKIRNIVNQHLDVLARKRFQLLSEDEYGVPQTEKWNKEVQYFFDKLIRPKLTDDEAKAIAPLLSRLATELVEDPARLRCLELERDLQFDPDMSPIDYERFCASLLERSDWTATVTVATGDQGVDVVAQKGGNKLVIQCKLYSQPVGNKAVQEVVAAKAHTRANYAAVVSNADYTPSARQLAATTGTILLHHADLIKIDEVLKNVDPRDARLIST